jgi:hypothetical protein
MGVMAMSHLGRYAAGLCVAGYGTLQLLGRQAGSTSQERRQALPGDGAVPDPHAVTDHAITIGAPPEAVWPWLAQMGWHRGGYYTPHWVDRLLFPANWPSLDVLDPGLVRDLAAGDTIPDGPPGTAWYVVEQATPPGTLVLHSTTHVPPSWRDRFGAAVDWTWSFQLTELSGGRTRLHVRLRGRAAPWWLAAGYIAGIIPADYVMATGMLRGLKRRAEQSHSASVRAQPATGRPRPAGSTARAGPGRVRPGKGPARYFAGHPLAYGLSLAGSGGTALYTLAAAGRPGQRQRVRWLALGALCAAQFAGIAAATELTRRRAHPGHQDQYRHQPARPAERPA